MVLNLLNKELPEVMTDISEVGGFLWNKGWAERNAGNISVNLKEYVTKEVKKILQSVPADEYRLGKTYPAIADHYFMVTGTGKRMRDLAREPHKTVILIHIGMTGSSYQLYPLSNIGHNFAPTSELPTHLAIHNQLVIDKRKDRAVVHTHPCELIALTQIRKFCSEESLNRLLWGMHPETMIFIPQGVGFIPYMLPGTPEIAEETLKKFRIHRLVLWEKHGCFATGKDVFEAFDLIDTVAKSAKIFFLCSSSGNDPEGLSDQQLQELKKLSDKFQDSAG